MRCWYSSLLLLMFKSSRVDVFEVEDASDVMDRITLFRRQYVRLIVDTNDADAGLDANEYCIVEMALEQ